MDYADHHVDPRIHVQKKEIVKKDIAFFDFDGTITTKDTLLEFIKFSKGTLSFFAGFALHLPHLLGYKLGLITNQRAKEKILRFFFRDTSLQEFEGYCSAFTKTVLPTLIRPKALQEIRNLQERGIIVAIVSASPENWITKWAQDQHAELIASRLEIHNGKITGKILGKNCHGDEKVNRILSEYNLSNYRIVAAYGDSKGDRPMLQLASKAHYKPFQ